jgi:UDP:flavonoid glycosyltransferase YjiC (YdhE family)
VATRAAGLPNVYVTLGTVLDEADLFRLLLNALADVNCNVLMTIGRGGDPASLAPCPANATVERFVPQADVFPTAASSSRMAAREPPTAHSPTDCRY